MKTDFFRQAGLLVAGPTTGKTTLLSQLKTKGINTVIDTDDVIKAIIPEFFEHKWYRKTHNAEGMYIAKCKDLIVANAVNQRVAKNTVVLSNLWSPTFLTALLGEGTKPSLYVGRVNADRVVNLASERGAPLSEGLVQKWLASTEIYVPRAFEHWIWLPDDLYLADVVTIANGNWSLTTIGKSLRNRNFADVKRLGLWDRGPGSQNEKKGGKNGTAM